MSGLSPALAPAAAVGALAVLLAATAGGALPEQVVIDVLERTWPILAFLVLIKVVADLCDDAGLFAVTARRLARFTRGRTWALVVLYAMLCVVVTTLLSLDTAAVLLTPVGIALARSGGFDPWPLAILTIWLANVASLLLPVSNLTNLLAAERSGDPAQLFASLLLPQALLIALAVGVFALLYRSRLPRVFEIPRDREDADPVLLALSGCAALALAPAIILGVAPWQAALGCLFVLITGFAVRRPERVTPARLVRLAPLTMAAATAALFIAVALIVAAAGPAIESVAGAAGSTAPDLLRLAGVAAVAGNVINNLPAYLLLEESAGEGPRLAALLIATNAGPLVAMWGSLANLLWWRVCRDRGLTVSLRTFAAHGAVLAVIVVPAGVLLLG